MDGRDEKKNSKILKRFLLKKLELISFPNLRGNYVYYGLKVI